ncbi:MAG: LacI family DNA-binding transcriptional regulator [Anaerolineae bacterium]|nr:LacI family DNA-binding transcriptional regulator [Anaerolineae bacterium]
MTKSTPSLRDVAQAAGVSLGTASRALNNKSNVLPTTRSLVLKAAADLGYKLQIRIPTTVAAKINTVGVIVKRDPGALPRLDPFYYAVLCGVEDECERLGLNLMYASLPVDEFSHATTWAPLLENGDVDGVVIVGVVFNERTIVRHIPRHVPVVVVDAYATGIECDTIITHNIRGAYNAVTYLIENGHTRIGLIGSTDQAPEHPGIRERRLGYVRALSEHRITQEYIEDGLLQGESAYAATVRLLQRAPEITAIFACNDDVAQSAMRAALDMGRRIPEDISFVGFDDTPYARDAHPPLTTMRIDKELMGGLAVRQIYERALNLDRPAITTLIGTQLVVRDSVAKCATGQVQPAR